VCSIAFGYGARARDRNLCRGTVMLTPGSREALGREQALEVLGELQEVERRLGDLKAHLRKLADEA
jgi:hypothetical protein